MQNGSPGKWAKHETKPKMKRWRIVSKFAHVNNFEDIRGDDRRIAKQTKMSEEVIKRKDPLQSRYKPKGVKTPKTPSKLGPILARRVKRRKINPPDQ